MPHFCFTFEPSAAGCVERVCLFSPWNQPARGPQGNPMSPADQAFAWLQQYAQQRDPYGQPILVFAPGAKAGCTCINPGGQGNAPNVYCIQRAIPVVDRQQVNAPFNAPVGNGYNLTMPPAAVKGRDPSTPQGMYEDLTDCALAASSDSILGEMDGAAGTYSDIDSRGNEVLRQMTAPYPKKVTG